MKRMLIDDTQPEETRVVIIDGNKVEDVEFESSLKKQLKGNVFTAKVIRIEPSLQAAFVDYGGNRHGFLAFGEIHPDYYNISDEIKAEVEKEVDEIIEKKRQYLAERKAEQERRRLEREQKRAEYEKAKEQAKEQEAQNQASPSEEEKEDTSEALTENSSLQTAEMKEAENKETEPANQSQSHTGCNCPQDCACRMADGECHCAENGVCTCSKPCECEENNTNACAAPACKCEKNCDESENSENTASLEQEETAKETSTDAELNENPAAESGEEKALRRKPRRTARFLGRRTPSKAKYKISAEAAGLNQDISISEDISEDKELQDADLEDELPNNTAFDNDEDDAYSERYLEIQRKLIFARKLYHRSTIQEVIKEGQTLLIQIVKEERGNKGAACTTYLSLAGRYCVLMPNRIRSGGVSRKITSATDRKRLKDIIRELPLNDDMSLIVRTAGEDKKKEEIVRDYNYLIRSWNHIRHTALSKKAPALIYEEGNLIKRALRDMCTKDVSEVIIDGDDAYKTAKEFSKILSPNLSRRIKCRKKGEIPVFQHYQIEKELDKLHNPVVQLQSGGYLVINPTEALVSIDVNSGRATREMDIEETALKTNLEAADEIARQLRLRNLAGLVVVDFIDMAEPANNHAVEKRMKEAMKQDRSRVQIAKMSIFGLLEISRQRMHSSFVESNYVTCPYCRGQGVQRTTESGAMLVLRAIEEEGIKGAYNTLNVALPEETAIYILNHKRRILADLEEKYEIEIIISSDHNIKNICDYRIDKSRQTRQKPAAQEAYAETPANDCACCDEDASYIKEEPSKEEQPAPVRRCDRRTRQSSRRVDSRRNWSQSTTEEPAPVASVTSTEEQAEAPAPKEKKTWWKKLIG